MITADMTRDRFGATLDEIRDHIDMARRLESIVIGAHTWEDFGPAVWGEVDAAGSPTGAASRRRLRAHSITQGLHLGWEEVWDCLVNGIGTPDDLWQLSQQQRPQEQLGGGLAGKLPL